MIDANGTAVVMKCCDLTRLEQYLRSLSIELSSEFFEIMPVQFVSNNKSATHQLMSINNKNLCMRKVVEFSECKKAKKNY